MLSYEAKGTYQDDNGHNWVFYQDDDDKSIFYILPRPDWVFDDHGNPQLELVTYETDDPKTNGSGYLTFSVELTVPKEVEEAITGTAIPKRFPDAPTPIKLQALDYDPRAQAILDLSVQSKQSQYVASASQFGANVATFTVDLTSTGMQTVQGLLQTSGGSLAVQYDIGVPARLRAVTANLYFDSSVAYQYQVTHRQEHAYSRATPRSVQKILHETDSSKVSLKWGIENPPESLVTTVTNWANDTLQTLITDKVNEQLAILGKENENSFSISSVSSFHAVFADDQVVDWRLAPTASLPSLKDLGKNLADFSTTASTRRQVMTVSAHLPFSKDSGEANVPKQDDKPLLLESVTVTVKYPGLSQADATHTFEANGSHRFEAPYDAGHGSTWDVSYTATYKGATGKVEGVSTGVDQADFPLDLPSVGILTVTFDAHQVFQPPAQTQKEVTEKVKSVNITFAYMNSQGLGTPVSQTRTIESSSTSELTRFTSYTAHPINAPYSYFVEYVFENGQTYTAPEVKNQNGFRQIVPAPPAPSITGVVIAFDESSGDPPVVDARAKVWFAEKTGVPSTSNQPTEDHPTVFDLKPTSSSGWSFASDNFSGYLNGNVPLVYSADITTVENQINIPPQTVQNLQPTILVNATVRYFTLEISTAAVAWKEAEFDSVQVVVTAAKYDKEQRQPAQTFNRPPTGQSSDSAYLTWKLDKDEKIAYSWIATYIQAGSTSKTLSGQGTQDDPILNVPAKPK